jgi:hypothetical protein
MEKAIFDLDGTLADNRHRRHLIEGEDKQWRKYLNKCSEDNPVSKVAKKARKLSDKFEIVILTMRSDEVEQKTWKWLKKHDIPFDELIMLPEGKWNVEGPDFKQEKLSDLDNSVMAFDNKIENCKMFRDNGLKSYHVKGLPKPVIKQI